MNGVAVHQGESGTCLGPCGRKKVEIYNVRGQLCEICYQKQRKPVGRCAGSCGRKSIRIENLRLQLCLRCYRRRNEVLGDCLGCERTDVALANPGAALCHSCEDKRRRGVACRDCGKVLAHNSSGRCRDCRNAATETARSALCRECQARSIDNVKRGLCKSCHERLSHGFPCNGCGAITKGKMGLCKVCFGIAQRTTERSCSHCHAPIARESRSGFCRVCLVERTHAQHPDRPIRKASRVECRHCKEKKVEFCRGFCGRCYDEVRKAEIAGVRKCENCNVGAIVRNGRCNECLALERAERAKSRQCEPRPVRFRCQHCAKALLRQPKSGSCRECLRTLNLALVPQAEIGTCRRCQRPSQIFARGYCNSCFGKIREAERFGELLCEECGIGLMFRNGRCSACIAASRSGECAECHRTATFKNRKERLCATCYGKTLGCFCQRCKKPLIVTRSGLCMDCGKEARREEGLAIHRRLMELANGHPGFEQLFEYWRTRVDPATYNWADRNEDLLRVAAAAGPIDREVLVRLPFKSSPINLLCAHLESVGLLDPVELDTERFLHRVERATETLTLADSVFLRKYATNVLLRRVQRQREYGERTDPMLNTPIKNLRYLARCSTKIVECTDAARSLATMSQSDLDALWEKASYRWRIALRSFVRWCNRRRTSTTLKLQKFEKAQRQVRMLPEELIAHHARATRGSDEVAARLAVLLTLRYLQPATAIGALHVSQLADDCSKIRFGDRWLVLEDPMPALFCQQLASRPDQSSCWVFPSSYYRGRPTSAKGIHSLFDRIGFPPQRARGASTINLLRTIEYPMLANILGLDVGSIAQWADLVGSPSEDQYIAMRRTQDAGPPSTVTIADRVYAEYRGEQLTGKNGPTSPLPPRPALRDEEFEETFSIYRVLLRCATPVFDPVARDTSTSTRLRARQPV